MINFELSPKIKNIRNLIHSLALNNLRPLSRQYDEEEHTKPADLIDMMHQLSRGGGISGVGKGRKEGPSDATLMNAVLAEELCWGDAGLTLLSLPGGGLGAAAIQATGTPEQKERFLKRFSEEKPTWGAMAITEPDAGSDTAAITTTATLDREKNEWVLNGEKIFVTSGKSALKDSKGFVVVWATVDKKQGGRE
jgi:acyl-CoA dehydrogenase